MSAPNRPHPAPGTPALPHPMIRADGTATSLRDFAPRPLVLFTYGKAGTPSCDNAIADFNALMADFTAAGVAVLGLSKDSPAALGRYLGKKDHSVDLASDPGDLMEEIGAFGDKVFMGKAVRGVLRSSFLFDGQSRLITSWAVDRVKDHARAVLDHVLALKP